MLGCGPPAANVECKIVGVAEPSLINHDAWKGKVSSFLLFLFLIIIIIIVSTSSYSNVFSLNFLSSWSSVVLQ
jgi:hypothetical protein